MKDFRKLQVWEKAHKFVLEIYRSSKEFPGEERYGLTSQLRRASASVPTNIAEGCGRGSDKELAQFVQIAISSASEVEYLLQLSHDLGYLNSALYDKLDDQIITIRKMMISLLHSIKRER